MCLTIVVQLFNFEKLHLCSCIEEHAVSAFVWSMERVYESQKICIFSHSAFILSRFMSLVRTWKTRNGVDQKERMLGPNHTLAISWYPCWCLNPTQVHHGSLKMVLMLLPWRSYRISGNSFTKSPTSIWIEGVSSNAMMSARWTITLSNQEEVDSWEKKKTEWGHNFHKLNLVLAFLVQIK